MADPAPPCVRSGGRGRDSLLVVGEGRHYPAGALGGGAVRAARHSRMVDVSQALVVAVLTRAPSSGGKSRLFRALGLAPDPALLSALLLDTLEGVTVPEVRRVVAV